MRKLHRLFNVEILLVLISTLASLALVEGSYRLYLRYNLAQQNPFTFEPDESASITFMAPPGRWKFNAAYGFDFLPKFLSGGIKNGAFKSCNLNTKGANSRGNFASRATNFGQADLNILMVGSSFTMGALSDGSFFHELLGDKLSKRLGKKVLVENFSRDSFGVIQMLDMAPVVTKKYKPDLVIIAFNTATLGMTRQWRTVNPADNGFHNFYFINEPEDKNLHSENALIHRHVMYSKVTPEWCDKMNAALKAKNDNILRNDPIVKAIIKRYHQNVRKAQKPKLAINFTDFSTSFLYNRLVHANAFWGMEIYKGNPIKPFDLSNYDDDPKFVHALERLKKFGVPFLFIHIPAYPEIKTGQEWASVGYGGIPADRELSLVESLERASGRKILSILPLIGAPRADAEELATKAKEPNRDWHPNKKGISLFVDAMTKLIIDNYGVK